MFDRSPQPRLREILFKCLFKRPVGPDEGMVLIDNGDRVGDTVKGLLPFLLGTGNKRELFCELFVLISELSEK